MPKKRSHHCTVCKTQVKLSCLGPHVVKCDCGFFWQISREKRCPRCANTEQKISNRHKKEAAASAKKQAKLDSKKCI
ncbi:hypothetical protein BO71DRAFT_154276 [Aspergillus ellipticus CBS 707.79]|uniref:Uncharacterized protein n=1 Tax=Aspergillus ellipticus CBS 707.79 TaxID=1448320 RepID=A0A319DHH6_9EURO|nr:hypothetical protein BO71DRAFT_154276 [Aspergillus ellipticus CBS 707.79]